MCLPTDRAGRKILHARARTCFSRCSKEKRSRPLEEPEVKDAWTIASPAKAARATADQCRHGQLQSGIPRPLLRGRLRRERPTRWAGRPLAAAGIPGASPREPPHAGAGTGRRSQVGGRGQPAAQIPPLAPSSFRAWFQETPHGGATSSQVRSCCGRHVHEYLEPRVGQSAFRRSARWAEGPATPPALCGRPLYDHGFLGRQKAARRDPALPQS